MEVRFFPGPHQTTNMNTLLTCRPNHFQVKYKINPWMKIGKVNGKESKKQWENLVKTYEELGFKVLVIDQDKRYPDMVFVADQGIYLGNNKFLTSNFRFEERKGETSIYKKWFKNYGLDLIESPKNIHFEGGGETYRYKNILFVGSGFRSDSNVVDYLKKVSSYEVFSLELIDKRFYHLDTCFFILDENYIFYYPKALSKKSINIIKKISKNNFEINYQDTLNFAANSVSIGNSVLVQQGSDNFCNTIRDLGYEVIELNVSEFIKAGGGIHCLTCFLN